MDNKFISKRILLAYTIALIAGTYFVASGIDYLINVLVVPALHDPHAYANSAICVLSGSILVGSARGLYQIYLHMIKDKMHESQCTIRDIHMLPRICDSYVGVSMIFLIMIMILGYRILHFMDMQVIQILHDPFKLFFGPTGLVGYGIYLVYRGNKNRKKSK